MGLRGVVGWAFIGRALMGQALYGAPWAIMGPAPMGLPGLLRAGAVWAPLGHDGPGPFAPPRALIGRALMVRALMDPVGCFFRNCHLACWFKVINVSSKYIYIYIYICEYTYRYLHRHMYMYTCIYTNVGRVRGRAGGPLPMTLSFRRYMYRYIDIYIYLVLKIHICIYIYISI